MSNEAVLPELEITDADEVEASLNLTDITPIELQTLVVTISRHLACRERQLLTALSEVRRLEGENRWIPVEEALPEKGAEILFDVPHCYGAEKGQRDGERWVSDRTSPYNDTVSFVTDEVTCWRKLPQPPVARAELLPSEAK